MASRKKEKVDGIDFLGSHTNLFGRFAYPKILAIDLFSSHKSGTNAHCFLLIPKK